MNKAYLLKKDRRVSLVYMAILIILSIIIIVKLFGLYFTNEMIGFKNLVYSDIDSKFFTNMVRSFNPSVEYYIESNNKTNGDIRNYNKVEALYGYNIPLISFIMNDRNHYYSTASENYPKINREDKVVKNDLEHYEYDESLISKSEYLIEQQTPVVSTKYTTEQLHDFSFLKSKIYTFDSSINPTKEKFPVDKFLSKDMSLDMGSDGPKVLIYHTHSQESFIDSVKGKKEDTVVGLGDELARILQEKYNIEVLHHRKEYDIINGKIDKNEAYHLIEAPLKNLIKKNPSIEVMIDMHRDGVRGDVRLISDVNGKQTAKIMFFNGLALYPVMPNKYVVDNMAFSFQLQLKANELYPKLARKIYLRGYRYNLHLKPKSVLIEVGAQNNTVGEAMNAMEPLAKILYEVIK